MRVEKLYLEDLSVGQRFVGTTTLTVTEAEIKEFAGRYDPQPFHLDDAAARRTLFGGLAASGWHTAALTMKLLVGSGPTLGWGIVGGGGEIAWPRPTRPGDVLHIECAVVEIIPSKSKPDRGMVLMRTETKNQDGELAQVTTMKLVVPRRP
ncbi:MAG TPA: MaoC family dehydratase [Alphaproteobacteria bacterium]|nr:MaoC family dehydratase [Alphaproteobacteria bacterium]